MEKTGSSQDHAVAIQGMNPVAQAANGGQMGESISGETIGQLIQMQNQYKSLKGLREKERASSQILVGALKDALLEINMNVSLSRESLSDGSSNIREGWLLPDSTVKVVDSAGTETSVPLENLPSHIMVSVLQESAVKLNQLMSQKVDSVARSVDLLEQAVSELNNEEVLSDQGPPPATNTQELAEKVEPQKAEERENGAGDKKTSKKPAKEVGRFALHWGVPDKSE